MLVLYFSMGVAGVAIATVVAQGVSVIGLWLHGKKHLACMQLQGQDMQPDWHLIQKICELGIPLALQNAMASISGVVCQGIVNSFGSQVMSAYTIVCRLNEFLCCHLAITAWRWRILPDRIPEQESTTVFIGAVGAVYISQVFIPLSAWLSFLPADGFWSVCLWMM